MSHIQSTSELASASSFSSGLWRLRRGAAGAAAVADEDEDEDEDDEDNEDLVEDDGAVAPEADGRARLVAPVLALELALVDLAGCLDALAWAPVVATAADEDLRAMASLAPPLPMLLVLTLPPAPLVRRGASRVLVAAARADMD